MSNDSNLATTSASTSELSGFLDEATSEHKIAKRGRLIFGLDATGSRSRAWDMAASLTAGMFREAASIGSLDLQLVYYRSDKECRASGWVSTGDQMVKLMGKIMCEPGATQIERILSHAIKETAREKVGALVFISDAMEENPDILVAKALELGKLNVPVFMFQDRLNALAIHAEHGVDDDVEKTYRAIATATGGAYATFDQGSAKRLGELLKAVAVFAAGGVLALEARKDEASVLLLGQMKGRAA